MSRILLTGSRNWRFHEKLGAALAAAIKHVPWTDDDTPPTIVEGEASGLDRMARAAAEHSGIPVDPHEANWSKGHHAGHMRNQHMVNLGADLAIGFPTPGARGTWDGMLRARRAGIELWVVASWLDTRLIDPAEVSAFLNASCPADIPVRLRREPVALASRSLDEYCLTCAA